LPERITIKERIERLLESTVTAIPGITAVERWSASGNTQQNLTALIIAEDESLTDQSLGGSGATLTYTLSVDIALCIAHAVGDENSSLVHNRWLGAMIEAVMANPDLVEPDTLDPLATDGVRVVNTSNPPVDDGQAEFYSILTLEIKYDVLINNPYTAPGVPEKVA